MKRGIRTQRPGMLFVCVTVLYNFFYVCITMKAKSLEEVCVCMSKKRDTSLMTPPDPS